MNPNRSYDCVVIGAGPAGASVATLVAEQGHSTLLIEREKLPRFHVGESLMPECYWAFERLGVIEEMNRIGFTRKNGVQFVSSDDKESHPFIFPDFDPHPSSTTWHVNRDQFDKMLVDVAFARGATCLDETRVLDLDLRAKGNHKLTIETSGKKQHEISARVVVDASGQSSLIANRLDLKQYYPDLKKAAIWGYFENAARNGGDNPEVTCILHTESKEAWFWYIPLANGTVSVGLVGDNGFILKRGSSPEKTFQSEMDNCPGLKRRLRDAHQTGRFNVAKEFSYMTKKQSGEGWVLVGDAAGFIDPIYSSGVFLALKSGVMAGEAVAEGLNTNNLTAEQLGKWTSEYDSGVHWIRKLVRAFYTNEFSFGGFMKAHPEHAGNLTDLLVGKVWEGNPGRIFDDLDPWIDRIKKGEMAASVSS